MATAQVCPSKHPLAKHPTMVSSCSDCSRTSSAMMHCSTCNYNRCMNCVRGVKPLGSSIVAPKPSYLAPASATAKTPATTAEPPEVDLDALLAQLSADPGVIKYEAEQKAKAAAAAAKPTAVSSYKTPAAAAAKPTATSSYKTPAATPAYKAPVTSTATSTTGGASDEVDLDKLLASLSGPATPSPATPALATPLAVQNLTPGSLIKITTTRQVNVTRYGYDDGEIGITVSGGHPYFYFDWKPSCNGYSDGNGTAQVSRLGEGFYELTVTDDGDNVAKMKYYITSPPKPAANDYDDDDDDDDDDDSYTSSSRSSSSGSSSARREKPAKPAKPATRTCPHCHGSGRKACGRNNCNSKCSNCGGARKVTCSVCKGKGEIRN